jgi:hypothetical protein
MPSPARVVPLAGGSQRAGGSRETRVRLVSPTSAVALAVVTVILVAAIVALSVLTHGSQVGWFINLPRIAIALVFAGVELVAALKQPNNTIGWHLMGSGAMLILASDTSAYLVLDYRLHSSHLSLGMMVVFLTSCAAEIAFLLLPIPILIFPTGWLPSSRWRGMLWA